MAAMGSSTPLRPSASFFQIEICRSHLLLVTGVGIRCVGVVHPQFALEPNVRRFACRGCVDGGFVIGDAATSTGIFASFGSAAPTC